jgi:MFS family permease
MASLSNGMRIIPAYDTAAMSDPSATRILVWMCVLIAVNQLGFGAIVPVIALYARSFGVLQSAIGVAIAVYVMAALSYAWFLIGCVVWSVAVGVSGAAPAAYAADVAPPGMNAAAMSTYRMLSDLGYVVGPIALGVLTDLFGADAALTTAAVLLVVVAVLFARFAPETYRSAP